MSEHLTMAEYVLRNDYHQKNYVKNARLVGSETIGVVEIANNPAGHYPDPPISDYNLQMITRGGCQARIDLGAGTFDCTMRQGTFAVSAPNVKTDYQVDDVFGLFIVGLPGHLLQKASDALGSAQVFDLEPLHDRVHRDPLIEQLVVRMVEEARAGDQHNTLFVDHAANTLAASLLALLGRINVKKIDARAMSKSMVQQIHSLMEDRLSEKLTLNELADFAGQDVFHFCRSFRAAQGRTPYQYLLDLRMKRGRELLARTSENLAAIAYDCGFSSQSHFTSAFSKHVGVSPGVYRRDFTN